MTRRRLPLIFALSMATLLVPACRGGDADRPADERIEEVPVAERYGGTATVALILDLQSMNSLTSTETYSRLVQRDVLFMPLFRYDESLTPVPWLAERWDTTRVSPDTLELTVHLRSDVRWHDGEPTTADDVLFTYQRARDPAVGSSLASSFALYSPAATRLDLHTVSFRLRPHSDFLDGWTQMAIMPRHVLGDVPPEQLAQHAFGSASPVGNGPFRFVRRVPGSEWVFEANPEFPEGLGGRPFLDRLVFRAVPEQTTLLTELVSGGVDVYLRVRADQIAQLEGSPSVRLASSPGQEWVFIAWNGRDPKFDTPEERRALTQGIDRPGIVAGLAAGQGRAGRSTVTPGHWAFDSTSAQVALSHDATRAANLLSQAGWVDRTGDGIREDEAGRPFRFTLLIPQGNDTGRDIAQVVQAQLRNIGVDVRLSVLEGNTLVSRIMGSEDGRGGRQREFEAVVMGWNDNLRKDDSNLFHSRNINNPFQITGYANPRVDALLDTLPLIMDREQARPLWLEYQTLLAQDAPKTVLFYPDRVTGIRQRLRGVEVDRRGELVSVARWWLQPDQRRGSPTAVN
ncbi:MAG: hypothetical protein H0U67_06105 [Gemmatimonadetes bacterium]|nr:hypothetical protein [Gemmatimonadota bacterium]